MLRSLIERASDSIDVQLFVVPSTVEEAVNSIDSARNELSRIRLETNVVNAVVDTNVLSGLSKRFFQLRQQNPQLTVNSWFKPYIDEPIETLASSNVAVQEDVDIMPSSTDYEILEDIAYELQHERETNRRPKSYEQWKHDIALWHFVKSKRAPLVTSPLNAKYWLVTVDFRLINFDKTKREHINSRVPVCIHPSSLIQLLQFWLPRDKQFEQAMLSSLRLPFLLYEFDIETEKVAIAILEVLSRYEIGDLREDAIKRILLNDALKDKLVQEPDEEKRQELISAAWIIENRRLEDELKSREELITKQQTTIDNLTSRVQELEIENQQNLDANVRLENSLESSSLTTQDLKGRVYELGELVNELSQSEKERKLKRYRRQAFLLWILLPLFISISGSYGIAIWLSSITVLHIVLVFTIIFLTLATIWLSILAHVSKTEERMNDWPVLKMAERTRNYLFWGILGVILFGSIEALWGEALLGLLNSS